MNKQSIFFTANEQTLEKTGGIDFYASNTVSYIEATFTLGDNWTGYDSVRAVWESRYATISTILDSNNKCVVPAEVLRYTSKVNVNLVGSIADGETLTDRLTTYPIKALTVDADARVTSDETQPVTASQFEQFVDRVHTDAESIQDYSYDSEAWAIGTRGGVAVTSADPAYNNNSKYYADQGASLEQEVSDLKSDIGEIDYSLLFEVGNLNITTSGWSYNPNDSRARTKEGFTIPLKAGDVIGLSDYTEHRYYLGWKNNQEEYKTSGWLTADRTITEDGDYVVLIATAEGVTVSDAKSLISLFKGYRPSAFSYINSNVKRLSTLAFYEVHNGTISSMGTEEPPTAKQEMFTDMISVNENDELRFHVEYPDSVLTWCAVATYDKDFNFISRSVLFSDWTAKQYDAYYKAATGVAFVRYIFRSYGTALLSITSSNPHSSTYDEKIYLLDAKVKNLSVLAFDTYDGYLSSTGTIGGQDPTQLEVYTDKFAVSEGDEVIIKINYSSSHSLWCAVATYDSEGVFISRQVLGESTVTEFEKTFTVPNLAHFIAFSYRTYGDADCTIYSFNRDVSTLPWKMKEISKEYPYSLSSLNPNINSVNHRGYNTIAPENTIPAFVLSRQRGFSMVETDVRFTSDGVAVCLHDSTINRTARNADGTELSETINISDITYEQVLEYDFGIWKSSAYQGTKIPTLEALLNICRNIGLHLYIEMKPMSVEQVATVVNIVKSCGMRGKVSYISYDTSVLEAIKVVDTEARMGFVANSITSSLIETLLALRTGSNEIFVDSSSYTDAEIALCKSSDLPLEVWNVNSVNTILSMNHYVSGVTSDSLIAGYELFKNNLD